MKVAKHIFKALNLTFLICPAFLKIQPYKLRAKYHSSEILQAVPFLPLALVSTWSHFSHNVMSRPLRNHLMRRLVLFVRKYWIVLLFKKIFFQFTKGKSQWITHVWSHRKIPICRSGEKSTWLVQPRLVLGLDKAGSGLVLWSDGSNTPLRAQGPSPLHHSPSWISPHSCLCCQGGKSYEWNRSSSRRWDWKKRLLPPVKVTLPFHPSALAWICQALSFPLSLCFPRDSQEKKYFTSLGLP